MAFIKLQNRLQNMPIIICGPIVRRTEATGVSIWIACRAAKKLELKVYDDSPIDLNVVASGKTETIQFGKNLHVAVITAKPVTGVKLNPDKIYSYNIFFDETNSNLMTPGIFSVLTVDKIKEQLAYGKNKLPTFCLPQDKNISNLKLVHGSCRKPHGGTKDALEAIHTMLWLWADDPKNRPQILFLTGDQIYADDVSELLLYLLIDAGEALMGWNEELPGYPGKKASDSKFKPGMRQEIIAKTGADGVGVNDLTVGIDEGDSHLMFLSEYYMMYLFVWSDILWPSDILTAFPDEPSPDSLDNSIFNKEFKKIDEETQRNTALKIDRGSAWDTLKAGGKLADAQAKRNEEKLSNIERIKNSIKKHKSVINNFKKGLPNIRKSLANISTYMTFDDHEITDDWFLTAKWAEKSLQANTLSRRVIQNGLSAFLVFQAWGNTPDKFEQKNNHSEKNVLALLSALSLGQQVWDSIGPYILPTLMPVGHSPIEETYKLESKPFQVKWNFYIDFEKFRIISLDCRTRRGYERNLLNPMEGNPALISPSGNEMNEQLILGANNIPVNFGVNRFLILISPAPFIGNIALEWQQELSRYPQSTQLTVRGKKTGMYDDDQEAWVFFSKAYDKFLSKLINYKHVLILSGDVHYAFSVLATAGLGWTLNRDFRLVNLTSSSLKNSTKQTHDVANDVPGTIKPIATAFWRRGVMLAEKLMTPAGPVRPMPSPHKYQWPSEPLSYEYFIDTERVKRALSQIQNPNSSAALNLARKYHQDGHDIIVGKDNIGLVIFNDSGKNIEHQIWFSAGQKDAPDYTESTIGSLPLTIHSNIPFLP